jgi:phosphate transport system protein
MVDLRKQFHEQLEEVRDANVRMGALVTESLPRATEALLAGDLGAAQELIDGDDALDLLALEVEEQCYQLLALQQPMAGDLRAIVTAIRMTSEIERSGDLVVNIMKGSRRIYGTTIDPRLRGLIERMSEQASRLFRLSIDAYVEGDANLAAALDDMDDRLDQLHKDYIQGIFEAHADGAGLDLQAAVQLALIGRYYERIGDHAVNIGERVRYMVTGWLPEHTGAARVEARSRLSQASGARTSAAAVDEAVADTEAATAEASSNGGAPTDDG